MDRRNLPILLLCVFSLAAVPATAEVALGGKVGTLGVGAELTAGLSPSWNVRLGLNGFSASETRSVNDIEYEAEADLRTATGWLDWHPGGRSFRVTGGLVYNGNEVNGHSKVPDSGVYVIGGVPVPAQLVGTLEAEAEFDPLAPYFGIGFGNAVRPGSRVSFFADLGVFYQGQADVTLRPNIPAGSPLNNPTARQALQILLDREAADIEDQAVDYDLYPVVAVGLAVRF
jgi:hypothetical protein